MGFYETQEANYEYRKSMRESYDEGYEAGYKQGKADALEIRPVLRRGKWVWNGDTLDWERLHYCSECKKYALRDTDGKYEVLSDFCPSCGADMREK